jgi:hypothetical protein
VTFYFSLLCAARLAARVAFTAALIFAQVADECPFGWGGVERGEIKGWSFPSGLGFDQQRCLSGAECAGFAGWD